MSPYESSVFALELAFPFDAQSPSRTALRDLIRHHPEAASLRQRSRLYRDVAQALLAELPRAPRGGWDYYDDDTAVRKYNEWCGGMLNEEGVRKFPIPFEAAGPYRAGGEARFATFTVAFLMVRDSNVDTMFRQRCTMSDSNLWDRATFRRLLEAVSVMQFAAVRSDVLYMIPNEDDYGLTAQDLADDRFEYLRELR